MTQETMTSAEYRKSQGLPAREPTANPDARSLASVAQRPSA